LIINCPFESARTLNKFQSRFSKNRAISKDFHFETNDVIEGEHFMFDFACSSIACGYCFIIPPFHFKTGLICSLLIHFDCIKFGFHCVHEDENELSHLVLRPAQQFSVKRFYRNLLKEFSHSK
jgi:hypothetical protein